MFSRVTITLSEDERTALVSMAGNDYRQPQEQLRYLLRTEAQKRGLLDASEHLPTTKEDRSAVQTAGAI
jgi:hypothetical protein